MLSLNEQTDANVAQFNDFNFILKLNLIIRDYVSNTINVIYNNIFVSLRETTLKNLIK
jgi:hypothetical protein